jgi:hypothetical protein
MSSDNQQINDKSAILAEIVAFNKQYKAYLDCQGPPNTCSTELTDNLKASIRNLMEFGKYSTNISDQAYDASRNAITSIYKNNILPLRTELDEKLKELNNLDSTISKEYKTRYDLTMYAGIVWATLATSVIYYVFRTI